MTESTPQPTEAETTETTGGTNIDADQVVVNNAPDGGGVDNNEGAGDAPEN